MCRGLFLEIKKIIARVSPKAEAALHNDTTENTKLATTVRRQSRVIHCVQGDGGPAHGTLLLHSASHEPLPTNPQGWKRGEESLEEATADLFLF